MRLGAAAFLAALICLVVPARAVDMPAAHWKYDNPFCQVVASVTPIPDVVASTTPTGGGLRYVVELYTGTGTTLAGHVTLVSDTDAYDASVPNANLSGAVEDRRLEPVIVTLPAPDRITYYFVDSYALDHGASVTCPSYVFPIGGTLSASPTGIPTLQAQHLQSLGSLKCGQVYIEPHMRGDLQSPVGAYGQEPLTAVARAYVDSNGYSIKEAIVHSSGVDGMDKYLLGAVGVHQFAPAQFLCVPVVGEMQIELRYSP